MLTKARAAWTWFIEGLVEALLWAVDRANRAAPHRLTLDAQGGVVQDPQGRRIGSLACGEGSAVFDPPDVARRLTGTVVDVAIPPAWLFRRDLDPVAVASLPFLDAFVRHQIDRITPWRVGDTHYAILQKPFPDDPNRIAVAVAVVPKRLVAGALAAIEPLHPKSVRLHAADDPDGDVAIALGTSRAKRAAGLRRAVTLGLAGAALLVVGAVALLQWQAGLVQDDIDEQDRVLAERQAVMARARRGADPGGEAAARLRQLRDGRPMAVAIIDALSAAVPDSAHLTALSIDGDHVTIAGVSTDPSGLVPALETSGTFAQVAFGAATTRAETGAGDRFSLEMKALPSLSDHAAPPPGDASTGSLPAPRGTP